MALTTKDLKLTLEGLVKDLFGDIEMRWIDAYFPFTFPSFELEILYEGKWLEMLGCGMLHPEILKNAGRKSEDVAWAAGLGLERFAMKLFNIPDVRLFWSNDPRFLEQFKEGQIIKFKPFSKVHMITNLVPSLLQRHLLLDRQFLRLPIKRPTLSDSRSRRRPH